LIPRVRATGRAFRSMSGRRVLIKPRRSPRTGAVIVSPASSSSTITHAGNSSRDEVHSSSTTAPLRAVAIENGVHPLGVDPSCDAPADSRGQALGPVNGAAVVPVEVSTTPPTSSVAPVLSSEDEPVVDLQIVDLRNGSALAHANGHARDHVNGHANGHTNGHANGSSNGHANGKGSGVSAIVASLGGFGADRVAFQAQADSPSCAECGSIMVRNGSCYKCLNCGSTSGCS